MRMLRTAEVTLEVTLEPMRGTDGTHYGGMVIHKDKKKTRQSWCWTPLRERRETCYVPGIILGALLPLDPFLVTTILKKEE